VNIDARLKAQNNGRSWRPCEHTRRGRHSLRPPEVLQSGSTVRRCRRCPVSIYSREGR